MEALTNYEILIEKIEIFIRKYYLNKVLRGLLVVGAVMFCGFVLIMFSEYLGDFNSTLRGILFFGYLFISIGVFIWLVVPPLFSYLKLGRIISHDEAARIIGEHFSHVEDKLLNTLQLKRLADHNPSQRTLIEASIDQKIITLRPVTFPSAVHIKDNIKYLKWLIIPVLIIIAVAVIAPAILKDSTERLIKHNQYFAPKMPFEFTVTNPRLVATQGDDFKVNIKLTGNKFPNDIYMETGSNTFKVDKENISSFHYVFSNVQGDITFHLIGNDFVSKEYRIKVNAKPTLLHFEAELKYPAYIQRKNEKIQDAGDLSLPEGTEVNWLLHSQNASGIQFLWNGHLTRLQNDKNVFVHRERIMKPGNYMVRALNAEIPLGDSVSYHINVIKDQAPSISVDEKRDSVSTKAIYFTGKAKDDYGFSSLLFHYTIIGNDGKEGHSYSTPVNADLKNNLTDFFYYWDLKKLKVNPGDNIKYYFEVEDNNTVSGPGKARTEERSLKIPTVGEMNKSLDEGAQEVRDKLTSAMKLADQIAKDKKKLSALLLNKKELSYDEKKQVEELLSKRDELNKIIKEAQEKNKQNILNRRENKTQDPELAEKENQMQNILDNIMDPQTEELMKALQKLLGKKSKNLDPSELAKMQTDDNSINKGLNRTLELMKRLDVQTKLKEGVNQLKNIANKQQQLAEQSKQASADVKDLQKKQKEVKNDFAQVQNLLDNVQKKNESLENQFEFEDPKNDEKKIEDKLTSSENNLNNNNKEQASSDQKQAAQQMQDLAIKMQKAMEENQQQDIVINSGNLRQLIKRLVQSSFSQEEIMEKFKSMQTDDPSYKSWVEKQKNIQDNMQTVQDSLTSLSERLPDIQSTVIKEMSSLNKNLGECLKFLENKWIRDANNSQKMVMTSMNNLALMLSETLTKMQDALKQTPKGGGGGGGGSHQRKTILELTEMQKKLNANMQAMRNKLARERQQNPGKAQDGGKSGGPGVGGSMSEQFAKLARQQAEIRHAIDEINERENKDGHHQLGDLASLSKDMSRTETDLVNKKVSEVTMNRQLKISTKMLEAEKADQQRDKDSKREAKAPQNDIPPGFVKALQAYKQEKVKQTELLKTTPSTLNGYYKAKVDKYFEQVNK